MARRSVRGKRVLVTGASSGIGQQLAVQFAELECPVVINGRRRERLEETATTIRDRGGRAVPVAGDITDPGVQNELVRVCRDELGGLDILVNNAGIGAIGMFAGAGSDRMRRVMEVNFFAAVELTRLAIPLLRAGSSPVIVNIGSVLGHRAMPLKSEYCASKFAMHGWSDALRAELAEEGIDVVLVSPSTTESEFFDSVIENSAGEYRRMSRARTPQWVARQVIRAIERGRHEVIPSWSGRGLVWLDRLVPSLANRLAARWGK
jgi:short-subunit dehydrogenase